MRIRRWCLVGVMAAVVSLAANNIASAQVVISSSPVVSYYTPPTVSYYTPPTVSYYSAPTVSYYSAPTVQYYSAPTVSYYSAPVVGYRSTTVTYPAHVHRGLFGRTVVRTPFYKLKY